jgi:hypothetical protein
MSTPASDPRALLTLRAFFTECFRPLCLANAKDKTKSAYTEAIGHWERRTMNPPLAEITKEVLLLFRSALLKPAPGEARQRQLGLLPDLPVERRDRSKLADSTLNKIIRQLNGLFRKAGPETVDPDAITEEGIVPKRLRIKPFKARLAEPRDVDPEVLNRIVAACATATYPQVPGVQAEDWWRAFIATALVCGYRKGGLLALPWAGVNWQRMEIRLPSRAEKTGKGDDPTPFNGTVGACLMKIRGDWALVFPWPHSERTLYRQWHAIQRAAGIERADWITIHDLKRASMTSYSDAGASPRALQKMGHHASLAMSVRYVRPIRETRRLVENLIMPEAFSEDFLDGGPRSADAG